MVLVVVMIEQLMIEELQQLLGLNSDKAKQNQLKKNNKIKAKILTNKGILSGCRTIIGGKTVPIKTPKKFAKKNA